MSRQTEPTALKLLKGRPSHTKLNKNEPKPEAGIEKKTDLKPYEQEMWDYLTPRFEKQGVISENDLHALYLLCQTWGEYCEAIDERNRQAEENGGIFPFISYGKNGVPYQNPLTGTLNTLRERLHKQMIQFGMTPSSRSHIIAIKSEDKNPWSDFE